MDILKIKAVVFDCDGVMFDTAFANRKYYDEVLHKFNKPDLTDEQFINIHMMTVKAAIGYLFPEMDDLSDVYHCLQNIGYHKFIKYMEMEEGFETLLGKLKDKGYIIGIATNRTDTMENILNDFHIKDYFDIVMTAAKVKNPKPDPEQLLNIMEQFKLNPDELFFIGDSLFDGEAANAANVKFAAFKNREMKADFNVNSMDELARILKIN